MRTWVFDVHPKVTGMGRFYGRVWIEDQDGNVVRFNGTYTEPEVRRRLALLLPLRQLADERSAWNLAAGGDLRRGIESRGGRQSGGIEGSDSLLGLLA